MEKSMHFCRWILIGLLTATLSCEAATYRYYNNTDVIGEIQYHRISSGDSWESLSYYYDVGYLELRRANPHIKSLKKNRGKVLLIPTQHVLPQRDMRQGIVVNLSEKRVYYFVNQNTVVTYPVAVGRSGWQTPSFRGYVTRTKVGPTWVVPKSIASYHYQKYGEHLPAAIPPGPNNPLGNYAIYTSKPRILIHGTNNEALIGKEVSSGCVRMFNRNIAELHDLVSVKDPVYFINQDEKIGVRNGYVYYEKTRPYKSGDRIEVYVMVEQLKEQGYDVEIDQTMIKEALKKNNGVPIAIGIAR